MLKKMISKRLLIGSIALFILLITYLFPPILKDNIKEKITYIEPVKNTIYLIDDNNIISRVNTHGIKNEDTIEYAKNIINALIINSELSLLNPKGFYSTIPENTKINNLELIDKTLKIDFSKEFLNMDNKNEEKIIESLVYSLTEINGIDNITIYVDSSLLQYLPNSKKIIPELLNRNYGINKIYEIDDIKNTTKTTVYYVNKCNDETYYTPVTFINNDNKDKIEIIINKLKSSPTTQTNLMSYLASSAELTNYEIKENIIDLSFNNYIFNSFDSKDITEEVKYTIGLSIKDNYLADKLVFNANNKKILDFELNLLE